MFKHSVLAFLVISALPLQTFSADSYAVKDPAQCTTPLDEESECIPLEKCGPMVNFINQIQNSVPPKIAEALRKFVCTAQAEKSTICCPTSNFDIDKEGNIIGPPPPLPDVSNHENLKYLPDDCGFIDDEEKISGGTTAQLLEFPWMALLIYRNRTTQELIPECGGTIVNERYILTAAHCIQNVPFEFVGVRVGEYSLLSEKDCSKVDPDSEICLPPVQHLLVEKFIVHPKYDPVSKINDIALLRVTKINMEPVNVQPICLPIHAEILNKTYDSGVVSGWGKTDAYGMNIIDKLQRLVIYKQNSTICRSLFDLKSPSSGFKTLCLGGEENKDSCAGDSGGPFQVADFYNDNARYFQRGLVSLGNRICGTKDFPALYTNIDYYLKWILDNITP